MKDKTNANVETSEVWNLLFTGNSEGNSKYRPIRVVDGRKVDGNKFKTEYSATFYFERGFVARFRVIIEEGSDTFGHMQEDGGGKKSASMVMNVYTMAEAIGGERTSQWMSKTIKGMMPNAQLSSIVRNADNMVSWYFGQLYSGGYAKLHTAVSKALDELNRPYNRITGALNVDAPELLAMDPSIAEELYTEYAIALGYNFIKRTWLVERGYVIPYYNAKGDY